MSILKKLIIHTSGRINIKQFIFQIFVIEV